MSQQQWTSVLTNAIPDSLPQDCRTILSEIQLIASNNAQLTPTPPITIKEFERIIIDTPERTSSSPSRRHLGHYKAALQSSNLLYLLCQHTYLPFQFGFTPTRWTTSIDTMLEKSPGNPHISKLRIIQPLEVQTTYHPTTRSGLQHRPQNHLGTTSPTYIVVRHPTPSSSTWMPPASFHLSTDIEQNTHL